MSAFGDIQDKQDADEVQLSANVAADYIEYHRSEVVGHESEGLLMYLSMLTGWAADANTHNNVLGMGPPGSGKSLTKNTVESLFDEGDTYTKTSASGNAILDSREWDVALIAPMDEYDKIDKPIIEVLKSSNPEDGGFAKDRNVEDPDAAGGYSPTEVSAEANPWVLLYAPSSKKGGVDNELQDRALVLYFSNDKHTRRAIGRKEFGHEHIDSSQYDDEYIYDSHALGAALREHVRELPVERHYETTDDAQSSRSDDGNADSGRVSDGEQYLAARSGDTPVYQPPWVWYSCEPMFNLDEDETNRVYGIVDNLIRASALLNHQHRERTEIEVYVDEDSTETETRQAVVVEPQDVANVQMCLPTLLSTTHQLTPLKRHLLEAVDATEAITDGDGTTVSDCQDWLEDNDIPHPTRGTLKTKMDELEENYYLDRYDSAGGPNGQADVYERRSQGALQPPRIEDLQSHADRDGITLAADDEVDIDPADPFKDCWDPIRDQPFRRTVRDFEAEFSGSAVTADTDAASFMTGPEDGPSGVGETNADDEPSQSSLTDVGEDGVDADTETTPTLSADGDVSDPTEQAVYEACRQQAGELFSDATDVTHYMGIVDTSEHSSGAEVSGTPADPDHELWQDRPDLTDDRVLSEVDAIQELQDAFKRLAEKGVVALDSDAGPPAMAKLRIADL